MTTETEDGEMWPQAQEHLEPAGAGGGRKAAPLEPLAGARSCPHPNFRLLASRTVTGSVTVGKPPVCGVLL